MNNANNNNRLFVISERNKSTPNANNNMNSNNNNNGYMIFPTEAGIRPAMPGQVNPHSNIIQFQGNEYTNERLYPKID
jgi:hypothetical protein